MLGLKAAYHHQHNVAVECFVSCNFWLCFLNVVQRTYVYVLVSMWLLQPGRLAVRTSVRPSVDQGCRVTRLRCRWIIGYAAATGAHSCRISSCRYTEQSRYTHTPPSSAAAAAAGASLVVRSLCRRRVTLRVCVYVYVLPPRPPRHRATLTVFVLPGIFVVGILRCDCKY